MRLQLVILAALPLLLCIPVTAQDDALKDELKKLEGAYRMVRGEEGGKPLAEAVVKTSRLVITDNKHTVNVGNDPPMIGMHTINPFEKPDSIDAIDTMGRFAGKTIKGIYKLDGDELTVCFSPPDEPRPKEFSTANRPGRLLHVWKRGG